MAAPWVETVTRTPMSWEEYLALGEDVRGEYYDGELVVAPYADAPHQRVTRRLVRLLDDVMPAGYEVLAPIGWSPRPGEEFIPDVVVVPYAGDAKRITAPPVLVVEVLSSDRSADLMLKAAKYAAAGLRRYWVVDRANGQMLVFERRDGVYESVRTVTTEQPAEVDFGIASVRIDLGELLA